MKSRKFGKMDNYVGSARALSEINPECFESVRDAILRSTDGYTTFDGRTFGAPGHESYTPPDIDLRHPMLVVASCAINEAMVA